MILAQAPIALQKPPQPKQRYGVLTSQRILLYKSVNDLNALALQVYPLANSEARLINNQCLVLAYRVKSEHHSNQGERISEVYPQEDAKAVEKMMMFEQAEAAQRWMHIISEIQKGE